LFPNQGSSLAVNKRLTPAPVRGLIFQMLNNGKHAGQPDESLLRCPALPSCPPFSCCRKFVFARLGSASDASFSIDLHRLPSRNGGRGFDIRKWPQAGRAAKMVRANQLVPLPDGSFRPASSVFKDAELSVNIESLMIEQGRPPEEALTGYGGPSLSPPSQRARCGQHGSQFPIVKDTGPGHDRAHGLVLGKKPDSFANAMVRAHRTSEAVEITVGAKVADPVRSEFVKRVSAADGPVRRTAARNVKHPARGRR
jgi:hypothetical protein